MRLLDWRIERLEKKVKKLRWEKKEWEKKMTLARTESTRNEITWVLIYIDAELGDTKKKLVKLWRKRTCKADAQ